MRINLGKHFFVLYPDNSIKEILLIGKNDVICFYGEYLDGCFRMFFPEYTIWILVEKRKICFDSDDEKQMPDWSTKTPIKNGYSLRLNQKDNFDLTLKITNNKNNIIVNFMPFLDQVDERFWLQSCTIKK